MILRFPCHPWHWLPMAAPFNAEELTGEKKKAAWSGPRGFRSIPLAIVGRGEPATAFAIIIMAPLPVKRKTRGERNLPASGKASLDANASTRGCQSGATVIGFACPGPRRSLRDITMPSGRALVIGINPPPVRAQWRWWNFVGTAPPSVVFVTVVSKSAAIHAAMFKHAS